MEESRLYNVYVRLTNRQDREFVVNDTPENLNDMVIQLYERDEVLEVNYGVEHADWTALDVLEEVGSWIDNEY